MPAGGDGCAVLVLWEESQRKTSPMQVQPFTRTPPTMEKQLLVEILLVLLTISPTMNLAPAWHMPPPPHLSVCEAATRRKKSRLVLISSQWITR